MKKVAIIMGSDSDFPVVSKAVTKLKEFGVPYEVHVMSAHRTPDAAIEFSGEKFKIVELKVQEESMDDEWAEPPAFGGCTTRGQSKPGEEQPLHFIKRTKESKGVQP